MLCATPSGIEAACDERPFVGEPPRLAESILVCEKVLSSSLIDRDQLCDEHAAVESAAALAPCGAGLDVGVQALLDRVYQDQQARRLERIECAKRSCEAINATVVELVQLALECRAY